MRIITVLTSFILIFTSLWCFMHMGNTYISVAFLLGVAMILHALGAVCSYIGSYKDLQKSSWILADGIATGVLGVLVLANQLTVDPMIPIFFGIWIMYSGMHRTIASTQMMMAKERGWGFVLGFGIVAIAMGIYSFFNNILLAFDNVLLVGIIFLIQGINVMALAVNMPGKYKIFSDDFLHRRSREEKNNEIDFVFGSPRSHEEMGHDEKDVLKKKRSLFRRTPKILEEEFSKEPDRMQESEHDSEQVRNHEGEQSDAAHEEENSIFTKVDMVESPVIEPIPDNDFGIPAELNKVFEQNDRGREREQDLEPERD